MTRPSRIVSGAQTGADIAGLRAAVSLGIETGGWCPYRCLTEDGPAPWLIPRYGLKETASPGYTTRTRLNTIEADATVVFGNLGSPGSRLALQTLRKYGKPVLCNPTPQALRAWAPLLGPQPIVLNVAGNRASKNPHLEAYVYAVLVHGLAVPGSRLPYTPVHELPVLTHEDRTAWVHPEGLAAAGYVASLDYRASTPAGGSHDPR